MERRSVLKGAALLPAAVAATATTANADGHGGTTAFVLVHGSWHGAWCWGLIEPLLEAAGHMSIAIDLPGHGLSARNPQAFVQRPLDPAAFATEPSSLAAIPIADYAAAVTEAATRARAAGAERVVAVGHSMGGVPVTFAAAGAPDLFDDIIYVAALAPTPGKPAGAYLAGEDQAANSKIGNVIMADP
ncbi:MAG: alpha/beta fold hydrolase, partial [Pseudomonadota bacterium]